MARYDRHGDSYSCEYRSWKMMHSRCRNKNDPAYHNYGGRGISVCDRWKDYQNFLDDMGRRPTPKHTLERIDNDQGYGPDNCKWATRAEQLRNRRISVFIDFNGQRLSAIDAARAMNIPYPTLCRRARLGLPLTARPHDNGGK